MVSSYIWKIHDIKYKDFLECLDVMKQENTMFMLELCDGKNGWNVLHYAAKNDQVEIIKELIQLQYDLDSKDRCGETALLFAARWGSWGAIKILVEAGADVKAPGAYDHSILYLATRAALNHMSWYSNDLDVKAQSEAIDLLLSRGAFDCGPYFGLHMACNLGLLEVVQAFFKHGADLNVLEKEGDTALMAAVKGYDLEYVQRMTKNLVDRKKREATGSTALLWTIRDGRIEIVKALLAAGADPSIVSKDDETAISLAEKTGQTETAALLRAN